MTPHLEGVTLTELLAENNGYLPEKTIKFISAQIVIALNDLHRKGITYRILNPDNVFIEDDGFIKLFNFEQAKQLTEND